MRKYRKRERYAPIGPQKFWHPYGLQSLRPEKFISVVNAILRGRQKLLPLSGAGKDSRSGGPARQDDS